MWMVLEICNEQTERQTHIPCSIFRYLTLNGFFKPPLYFWYCSSNNPAAGRVFPCLAQGHLSRVLINPGAWIGLLWLSSSSSLHHYPAAKLAIEGCCRNFPLPLLGNGSSGCVSVGFPVKMMWCEEDSFGLIRPGLPRSALVSLECT